MPCIPVTVSGLAVFTAGNERIKEKESAMTKQITVKDRSSDEIKGTFYEGVIIF